ncbi:hypothetical protein EYC84_005891 [Monilinia fructicola]|uniref:Uncharacterized protein n=1 Tax=Monilinia fructicola TaxID=38448 RepID=A0A5M9K0J7_MONFR|nr:hypothetical protein EYC84_005891 [Monilinia fructicola]
MGFGLRVMLLIRTLKTDPAPYMFQDGVPDIHNIFLAFPTSGQHLQHPRKRITHREDVKDMVDEAEAAARGQRRRCRGHQKEEGHGGAAPVTKKAIVIGLQFLFLEPNASDPLNKEAAEDLRSNREGFKTECLMGRPCGRVMYAFGVASFSDTDDVGMGAYGLDMNDYTFNIRHDR